MKIGLTFTGFWRIKMKDFKFDFYDEDLYDEIILAEMQEYFCQFQDEENIKEEEYYFTHRSMKEPK